MDICLEKMQKLIEKSNLSEDDRIQFLFACASIEEKKLYDLVTICESAEGMTEELAENFIKKIKAVNDDDMENWKNIVNEEISEIDDMEKIAFIQGEMAKI